MDCAVYRNGVRGEGSGSWREALDEVRRTRSGFVWIGLHEPTENQLSPLAEAFDLHPLAVEDAVHAHQRPKLDRYDECLFAVVKTVHYNSTGGLETTEVVETAAPSARHDLAFVTIRTEVQRDEQRRFHAVLCEGAQQRLIPLQR